MSRARSIAVAQTCPVKGDVSANVDEHLRLTQIAAKEGAQVAIFPELSLTGYELDLASKLAFSETDPRLLPLVEAAASAAVSLIVGAPIRIGTRLHIRAFVVRPDRTTTVYTKHYLGAFSAAAARDGIVPPPEASVFEPGDRNPVVDVGGRAAATAICSDVGRPSHPQEAAAKGARAYLASMFVIRSELEAESVNLRRYALEHSMVVAFANYGGSSGGLAAAGRSSIWSETGELGAQLPASGADVAVATQAAGH